MNKEEQDKVMASFARDVDTGLSNKPRSLSSKYFYDNTGSEIFREIMALPEYYLTNAELDIMTHRAIDILEKTGLSGQFNVIELGAGDGAKTCHLLQAFVEAGASPIYRPIDISQKAVDIVSKRMGTELPSLDVIPAVGDYFEVLKQITGSGLPSLVLFLGSNIGNYVPPDNISMMDLMVSNMKPNDYLLLGVDLQKNPRLIQAAYDDRNGVTRRFNLNLLTRINRELGADFNLEKWDFYCHYNPLNGEVRSYIVSLEDQEVDVSALAKSFTFGKDELIWTELSKKYSFTELEALGEAVGLIMKEHFLDRQGFFTDTLFKKK